MDATNHFTGKATVYSKSRPGYPDQLLTVLIEKYGWNDESVIADIGAGTGILTGQMLNKGLNVMAVEPNTDMRLLSEQAWGDYPNYKSVNGTAEQTTLVAGNVDHITVAQAFHWFNPELFRLECQRVLKPQRYVSLIWNSRVAEHALVIENAEICQRYCPQFNGFSGGFEQSDEKISSFFRSGEYEVIEMANDLSFDRNSFIDRNLSASYAPNVQDKAFEPFVQELTALFEKYAVHGRELLMPNICKCYTGQV